MLRSKVETLEKQLLLPINLESGYELMSKHFTVHNFHNIKDSCQFSEDVSFPESSATGQAMKRWQKLQTTKKNKKTQAPFQILHISD